MTPGLSFPCVLPRRLRTRLVVLLGAVVSTSVLYLAFYQAEQVAELSVASETKAAVELARSYAEALRADPTRRGSLSSIHIPSAIYTSDLVSLTVLEAKGDANEHLPHFAIRNPSAPSTIAFGRLTPEVQVDYEPAFNAVGIEFGHSPKSIHVTHPIGEQGSLGWVSLSLKTTQARQLRRQAFIKAVESGAVALACCVVAVVLVIRRPLRALEVASVFVSGLDRNFEKIFSAPCSTVELQQLGRSINEASFRLQKQQHALQASELKMRAVLSRLNEVVFETDDQGRWTYLNPAWSAITHFSVSDSMNKRSIRFLHRHDRKSCLRLVKELRTGKTSISRQEFRYVNKEGDARWIEISLQLHIDDQGRSAGFTGTLIDVHDRRTAQETLRNQLQFTRQMLDAIPVPVFYQSCAARFLGVNEAYSDMFGYPAHDYAGKMIEDVLSPELARSHTKGDAQVIATRSRLSYETSIVAFGGQTRHVVCSKAAFSLATGELGGIIGVFLDVTEREHAKRAMIESKEFLYRIIDAVPNPIFVKDYFGRLQLVNDAWVKLAQIPREDAIGKNDNHFPVDQQQIISCDWADLAYGNPTESELTITQTDGQVRRLIKRTSKLRSPENEDFIIGLITDVTQISLAKEEIEEQLRFTRELVDGLPFPVFLKDRGHKHLLMNRAAEVFFNTTLTEVLEKQAEESTGAGSQNIDRDMEERVLQTGCSLSYEAQYINAAGNQLDTILTKTPFTNRDGTLNGVICTITDVTERKRVERRLQVQYEIARILNDAPSVRDASLRIMHVICSELHYSAGALWEVNPEDQYMECVQVWCAPGYDSSSLAVTAQNLRVTRNVGLAGRVWATGMPQGVPSLPADTILPQLGCSFALPVKVGAEVIAVMHFFGGRAEPAEADLIAMFEATGHQIGQFMHRERTQQSLRASEAAARKLSLVASHTLNAVIITDTNCRIEWVNDAFTDITGYTREDADARRLDELLHPAEADKRVGELMRERINRGEGFTAELTNQRSSGDKYWVSLEVQPVFSPARELTNFIAIATDITERKLSEVALIEANIQLNLALEGASLALWSWHISTNIMYLSDMWSVMLGGPKRDTVTHIDEFRQSIATEDIVSLKRSIVATLGGDQAQRAVYRVKGTDGEWRWIQSHGRVVERAPDGRALRLAGISADVTERYRAELALRKSEERYNLAVSGANDGIWDLNLAERRWYMSDRFAELLNIQNGSHGEVLEYWHSLFHPDDREAEQHALTRHLEDNEPYDVEYRMATRDGTFRWFRVRGKALQDAKGRPYRVAGSITDTTDYRLAREQLEETRDRLDSILRSADHMIWSRSVDLRTLLYINPAVRNIYGREPAEFYAQPTLWMEAVHQDDRERVATAMSEVFTNSNVEVEFRIVRSDGSVAWVNDRISVAYNALGDAIRIDTITSDITELKSREIELRAAKEAAEAATRAKSEFLANMSHEIRTPMNGILGIADLALTGRLSSKQREHIELVRSSATALLELINDILDFSKIEAGMLHFESTPFLLRETLTDSLKLIAVRAEEKGLELIWRVNADVPDLLIGDPLRLRQVVTNLLSNAVKFTTQGEVELCVGLSEATDNEVTLLFAVRDTGIGFPEEKTDAIFQPFSQADMSTTRKYGGTGLGLTICDRLVRMMKGNIEVRSELGHGSTFCFSAVFEVVTDRPDKGDDPAFDFNGIKIVVCDDNPAQLVAISEILYSWGMNCRSTDSLSQALTVMEDAAATELPFQVALVDSQLMDGDYKKLIAKVRARASLEETPLVLLMPVNDAYSSRALKQAYKAVHITKPFSYAELQVALATALGRVLPEKTTQANVAKSMRKLRILLVEDNEINIRFASGALEKLSHVLTVARNGLEAVQMVSAHVEDPFDIVLMDVQMPLMSGLEATAAIRILEHGKNRHLPIIAMTANAMSGDRERCIEAGMDDYISKPVSIADLTRVIERVLPRDTARPNRRVPAQRSKTIAKASQNRRSKSAYDRDTVLETLNHDKEAFRELCQMLIVDHKLMLSGAEQALYAGEIQKAAAIAHTLKGMVGNFAARNTSRAAQRFYVASSSGNRDRAARALEQLKRELALLSDALQRDLLVQEPS